MTSHLDSKLYALGSNGSGQLALGHTDDVSSPCLVLRHPRVSKADIFAIAAGGNHTLVCFRDMTIAATGDTKDGKCLTSSHVDTHGSMHILRSPNFFDDRDSALRFVAATWAATITIRDSGAVYAAGSGEFGELGLGMATKIASQTTLIEDFPPPDTTVVKLASSMGHVVAVLSSGEVWGWGNGRRGQLGEPPEVVWKPRKIGGINFSAVDAVCGKDFSCIFGHPSTGHLLVFGPRGADRFGIRKFAPTTLLGWKQVAASWGSIFALSESGKLLGWGRNDHGQLPPSNLPKLVQIAAGSEHCLGLTEAGKVLAWGWGEHGNCGLPLESDGDVGERWNELELPRSASRVFAGCATSFIVTEERRCSNIDGADQSNIP